MKFLPEAGLKLLRAAGKLTEAGCRLSSAEEPRQICLHLNARLFHAVALDCPNEQGSGQLSIVRTTNPYNGTNNLKFDSIL